MKTTKRILLTTILFAALGFGLNAAVIVIDDNVTNGANGIPTTWAPPDTYVLDGFVFVEPGFSLTIAPGTLIKAKTGVGVNASALIVCRGATINADGTIADPIVFTSEFDQIQDVHDENSNLGIEDISLWGGVIILGSARLNSTPDGTCPSPDPCLLETVIEGIPSSYGALAMYGGEDDNDNSGVFRYVSIRHGGSVLEANNEINGLTMGGVGAGTTISHVEVFGNKDDAFEWFGGNVNTHHLVGAFCNDDHFDWDQGFRGKGQFWFCVETSIGTDAGDHGAENDGAEKDFMNDPNLPFQGGANVFNATMIGRGQGIGSQAIRLRENNVGKYRNSYFTEYARAFRIDSNTQSNIGAPDSGTGLLLEGNMAVNCWVTNNDAPGNITGGAPAEEFYSNAAYDNVFTGPALNNISRELDGTLDPRPSAAVPVAAGAPMPPGDGFFDTSANYIGAFDPASPTLWYDGWTKLSQVLNPPIEVLGEDQGPGAHLDLEFDSVTGVNYQLQYSTDLDTWVNDGDPIAGDDTRLVVPVLKDETREFFRFAYSDGSGDHKTDPVGYVTFNVAGAGADPQTYSFIAPSMTDPASAADTPGTVTLAEFFANATDVLTGDEVAVADEVLFLDPVTKDIKVYFKFYSAGPPEIGPFWVDSFLNICDDDPIPLGQGLIYKRKDPNPMSFKFAGSVEARNNHVRIRSGYNVVGAVNPVGTILDLSALKESGLLGGTEIALADEITIYTGGAGAVYWYYQAEPLDGFEGWYDSSFNPAGNVLIEGGSSFIYNRKSGDYWWTSVVPVNVD